MLINICHIRKIINSSITNMAGYLTAQNIKRSFTYSMKNIIIKILLLLLLLKYYTTTHFFLDTANSADNT